MLYYHYDLMGLGIVEQHTGWAVQSLYGRLPVVQSEAVLSGDIAAKQNGW